MQGFLEESFGLPFQSPQPEKNINEFPLVVQFSVLWCLLCPSLAEVTLPILAGFVLKHKKGPGCVLSSKCWFRVLNRVGLGAVENKWEHLQDFLGLKGWSGWLHFQIQQDGFSLDLTFPIEKAKLTFAIV